MLVKIQDLDNVFINDVNVGSVASAFPNHPQIADQLQTALTNYYADKPVDNDIFPEDLAEAKTYLEAKINQVAEDKILQLIKPYTLAQAVSWRVKEQESRLFVNNKNLGSVPNLLAEAIARFKLPANATTAQKTSATLALANAVIAKADILNPLVAAIEGSAGNHRQAIQAIDSIEKLKAYDYQANW